MHNEAERTKFLELARAKALTDGCKDSIESVKSGIRCYMHFAEKVLNKRSGRLPPSVDELLTWSRFFRCKGTFENYCGYLRLACLLEGVSVEAFDHPSLKRAKVAIKKRMLFRPRARLFIKRPLLKQLLDHCAATKRRLGMLFLTSYIFLLRVPSEALPLVCGDSGLADEGQEQSVLYCDSDQQVCLKLKKRKNKPEGSLLKRGCWCRSVDRSLCPVHVLWEYMQQFSFGQKVFGDISASSALWELRRCLGELGTPDAELYRCHDFRRGHADDLRESGADMSEIKATLDHLSDAAKLRYLNLVDLEANRVGRGHLSESSSEDEDSDSN